MKSASELIHFHPSRVSFEGTSDAMHRHEMPRKTLGIGWLIALILFGVGLYWVMPEFSMRYIKIERM